MSRMIDLGCLRSMPTRLPRPAAPVAVSCGCHPSWHRASSQSDPCSKRSVGKAALSGPLPKRVEGTADIRIALVAALRDASDGVRHAGGQRGVARAKRGGRNVIAPEALQVRQPGVEPLL